MPCDLEKQVRKTTGDVASRFPHLLYGKSSMFIILVIKVKNKFVRFLNGKEEKYLISLGLIKRYYEEISTEI